jgi:hypothetical protein
VTTELRTSRPRSRLALGYGLMVLATVAGFLLIRRHGETLLAPEPGAVPSGAAPGDPAGILLQVLAALTAVIVTGQLLARAFAALGQPPVIGEVVAGILLGPSFLGAELSARILPPAVAPYLGVVAQLGVILSMFLDGRELDEGLRRARARAGCSPSAARRWPT